MDHLDKLLVKPSEFALGFNKEVQKYFSWETYLDTWKLVDKGLEDPFELPLFYAFVKYFSGKDQKRLEYEQRFLNLSVATPESISYALVKRQILLYHS